MSELFYSEKYASDAKGLTDVKPDALGTICWESPSNIALVKYWGKYGNQLPQNPSLSFTLKNSKTITRLKYQKAKNAHPNIEFYFDNQKDSVFGEKIKGYLKHISVYLPFINNINLSIESQNTFPHSAGIASSASSFSALALCLCSFENDLFKTLGNTDDFYRKASFLARLGSGSACRSVYGKTAIWGKTNLANGSTNEFAVSMDSKVHEVFKTYRDAILIIDSDKKLFSSTKGHSLMEQHPFANARYQQANGNMEKLLDALAHGDETSFAQIIENEAFTLHGLMLSSSPSVNLLKPSSLAAISKLVAFRKENNFNFTFTMDAGPNIHILYPSSIRKQMVDFISSELLTHCENGKWIDDELSEGPIQKNSNTVEV